MLIASKWIKAASRGIRVTHFEAGSGMERFRISNRPGLATRSITLLVLMNDVVYDWKRYWVPRDGAFSIWRKRGGSLPPTQREIFEEGCLELCRENNPDRETPKLHRQFTAEQRIAVASRIAATLIFCRRSAVRL